MSEIPEEQLLELYRKIGEYLYLSKGTRRYNQFHDTVYGIDSIKNTIHSPEIESPGFTFVTRPKLNLTTSSLRQDRILSLLDSLEPSSISFAVRGLLDTKLCKLYNISVKEDASFFNPSNPFIPLLTNRLLTMNGWPDWMLDVETSEGGFFSESITYPKGHDQLTRNYDIQASYSDVRGSIVLILFTMWFRYIHLLTRGIITSYMEDIDNRRMGFTSSIYRFVMDPSNRYILKWGKATGCYPRSVPLGAYFNYDSNVNHVESSMNLSIPWTVAGRVEYYDPIILKEFNMVVEKYCPGIKRFKIARGEERLLLNFRCIPYIDTESGNNELQWRYDARDASVVQLLKLTSPVISEIQKKVEQVASIARRFI